MKTCSLSLPWHVPQKLLVMIRTQGENKGNYIQKQSVANELSSILLHVHGVDPYFYKVIFLP
jgi:hypothetical protein